uniref:Transmembrane protein n=1 Tax=Heterorhabditis bacteriophora TaxID=37862 RepID=A0A1I7X4Y0_HETBA
MHYVKIMNIIGKGTSPIVIRIAAITHTHTTNCLGIIACAEIFLVPILISMVFVQAFAQMRFSLDQVSASANCPQPVRILIPKSKKSRYFQ